MLKIRVDVDYPHPSRFRSFICTTLGVRFGKDYLKNSKIAAKMINESAVEVKAYWFFTPKTIPDRELLELLDNSKHEVALHIVNDPIKELQLLERSTQRKMSYYTIHGTDRFLARIMWKRWKTKSPKIPENLPLQSFYQFTTTSLDVICHTRTAEQALELARNCIAEGHVIHFHPIWLFQRGRINHRGPFYELLRRILEVDKELETLIRGKKSFFTIASDEGEYERDIEPTAGFIEKLEERGVDVFTFIERRWVHTMPNPPKSWLRADDNIALLHITSYDEWLRAIGKKTRNMIRKAEKSGIKTRVVEPNEELAEGIWKIYNETPIRQERGFPWYGTSLKTVRKSVFSSQEYIYIGAYFQDELAGFIQLAHSDNTARISKILSLQKHLDKAVNNALAAKAVEVCASRGVRYLMYGRMGNHPTLDDFKQNNGCVKFELTRYYVPLTKKGRIATRLGVHREMKDALPQSIRYRLIPVYNWISRTRVRIKLRSKQKL